MHKQRGNLSGSFIIGAVLAGFLAGVWVRRRQQRRAGGLTLFPPGGKPGRALVTGASSGIGAEFARQLAARGYDLVLVARRVERLQALAEELHRQYGVSADVVAADLADPADLKRVQDYAAGLDRVDLLVNDAGFGAPELFAEAELEKQLDMVRVHDMASISLVHAVLPGMIARNSGGIINVASVAAFMVLPGTANYSASKAYLVVFSEGLQRELQQKGVQVQVQALCPGFTVSEFHDSANGERRRIPRFLWLTAKQVVGQSLDALGQGEVVFIPGFWYRLGVGLATEKLTGNVLRWAAWTYERVSR